MEGDLETYAPRSPDLSGEIDEPHPQHREYRGSVSHISPFTPTDARPSPFTFPPTSAQLLNLTPLQGHPPPVFEQNTTSPPFNPYFGNTYTTPEHQQQSVYAQGMVKQEPEEYGDESGDYQPESSSKPPRVKKMKKEEDMGENHAPGVQEGIEVRTKFPVARIKRIMQADEDVGKVAQVTPVVVCKYPFTPYSLTPHMTNTPPSQSPRALHDQSRLQSRRPSAQPRLQTRPRRAPQASRPRRRTIRFPARDRE